MQAPATAAPPDVPLWMVVVMIAATIAGFFNHWRFRTGWHLRDRYQHRPDAKAFVIMLGYAALPAAIAAASMAAMLVMFRAAGSKPTAGLGYPIMFLAVVTVVSCTWMAKEYFRPSRRRTPDWLK